MKNLKLLFAAAVCSGSMYAQHFYGEILHNEVQTTDLTTATQVTTSTNAGFLIGGSVPTSAVGVPNFILNKLSTDGTLTGGGNPFSRNYFIYGNGACGASPAQVNNCAGITAKEYNGNAGMAYAVTGAFDEGCFFMSLDNTGNIINKSFFTFPATSSQASKPVMVTSPGLICIIGSFVTSSLNARQVYVIKVSQNGTLLQSKAYNMASPCSMPGQCPCGLYGFDMIPNDAIISPYASTYPGVTSEIIVVGEAKKYGNWGLSCLPLNESSGFFLRLGSNNLNALYSSLYDYSGGINIFNSVAPAQSTPGTEGFIIGGFSDFNFSFGQSWMIKLDYQNAVPLWSSLLSSTYGNTASFASGVGYRNSFAYGDTYYGALYKGNGAVVAKLDGSGNPFSSTFPIDNKNEFNYLASGAASIYSRMLTMDVNPADPNEGIHVYGSGNTNQYFVGLATFNGVSNFSGCSTSSTSNGLTTAQGPLNAQFRAVIPMSSGLVTACQNFNATSSAFTPASTTPCQFSGGLPTNGSNNKPATATGLKDQVSTAETSFRFLPNPTSGKLLIDFTANNNTVNIMVYDNMGKKVLDVLSNEKPITGQQSIQVDLSGLPGGIYFAKINTDNKITCHKIIYTKD